MQTDVSTSCSSTAFLKPHQSDSHYSTIHPVLFFKVITYCGNQIVGIFAHRCKVCCFVVVIVYFVCLLILFVQSCICSREDRKKLFVEITEQTLNFVMLSCEKVS